MRDSRFPSHKDVMEALLCWASNGEPYTAEEVRGGIAISLGVTPELQKELFRPSPAMTRWENYVAHGLSWHSRAPEAHILGQDGYYRLTVLGADMASRAAGPKRQAESQELIDEASASMTAPEEWPADGDHRISKVEIMLDEINETAMERATNQEAGAKVLIKHIEDLTAALRTMRPKAD